MAKNQDQEITGLPEYQKLLSERRKLVWPLLFLTIFIYFAFILTIAFTPELLSSPVGEGVISRGIYAGFVVILCTFCITGYYAYRANQVLEPLVERIQQKVDEK